MDSPSSEPVRHDLLEYLTQFVSPARRERMEATLAGRTRHLAVVLEDVFQPYNASACLRTCEALGVQDLHLIENRYAFRINRDIALGAGNWLTLRKYTGAASTRECLSGLRDRGYQIVSTMPRTDAVPLEDFQLTRKTAIVFGSEMDGLSNEALSLTDVCVSIPTSGFAQSLNLSVCCAVCVHHLMTQLKRSQLSWGLTEEEKFELRLAWVKQSTRRWLEPLERHFDRERMGSEV